MGNRNNRDLVCNALMMALWRRKHPKGVIVHSDHIELSNPAATVQDDGLKYAGDHHDAWWRFVFNQK